MKTMTKKLASIVLALCLCFSLVGTALAASSSEDKFTITVTNAANGETYTAYKIFDATYDGDNYSYTIQNSVIDNGDGTYSDSNPWYSIVAAATDVFTLTQVNGTDTYIVTVKDGVDDDAVIAVFTEAGVPDGATVAASEKASDGQAVLDVTSSGAGYYYVTTSLGSLVIINTINPTETIKEKNGTPSISKWVYNGDAPTTADPEEDDWDHEDDANNNSTIYFELDVDHINGAVNLVIHDYMPNEFTEEDWSSFGLDYIAIVDGNTTTVLTQDDYTIKLTGAASEDCSDPTCEINTTHGCTFEIDFSKYDFSNVSEDAVIVVIYDATLNTEGDNYEDDVDEIDNWAMVTFGATSGSVVVEAETYSFGFETYKYDGDTEEPLEGVEFELKNSSGVKAYFETETVNGKTIYLLEGYAEEVPTGYTSTLVTGSDGMIYIEGLDTGTYTLTETKALDGYNPLTGDVTVTISAEYDEQTGELTNHTVTYIYNGTTNTGVVSIENNTGSELPGTGGMGTTIFYIIGGVLVAGAVVVLITRRRMSSNEG